MFRILTVCTGNICRSPLAEAALGAAVADAAGAPVIELASRGIGAVVGAPPPSELVDVAPEFAVALAAHRSQQLDRQAIDDAGLVLAMSREHRRAVVELVPRATRRVFTIREFARLGADLTGADLAGEVTLGAPQVQRLAEVVDLVASRRGFVDRPDEPEDDDVTDPFGLSLDVYLRMRQELLPAVAQTARVLRLALD